MMLAPLVLSLAAGTSALALDRAAYIVDQSSAGATVCSVRDGLDDCRMDRGLTLPDGSRPLTFAAFGDCGQGGDAQAAVAKRLSGLDPDLVLLLGDVVYPTGENEDYDSRYFPYYGALAARRPFFPAVGNHDYGNTWFTLRGRRRFETGYARVFHRPPYYSFDAGPIHFVSLDTNQAYGIGAAAPVGADSEQARWLENDLAASRSPWKIAFMHVPLYSTTKHADNAFLRKALEPIFKRHGVALALAGHDHTYERSQPIDGIVYVTAGTGGSALTLAESGASWLAKKIGKHGMVVVHAEPRRLLVEFLDAEGLAADSFELKK